MEDDDLYNLEDFQDQEAPATTQNETEKEEEAKTQEIKKPEEEPKEISTNENIIQKYN